MNDVYLGDTKNVYVRVFRTTRHKTFRALLDFRFLRRRVEDMAAFWVVVKVYRRFRGSCNNKRTISLHNHVIDV